MLLSFGYRQPLAMMSWLPAGMFGIIGVLVATSAASQPRAEQLCALFQPAVAWIEKWLALFYVPSLIMLPLSLRSISGELHTIAL